MKMRKTVLVAAVVSVLILLTCAEVAFAQAKPPAGAPDVGTNLKGWLSGLGQDVLIPITGLFGIGALFRRDIGAALLVAMIAIIVGVFVYDPSGAANVISGVANTLTK